MSTAVDCLEFLPDQLVVEVSRGLLGCADDLPRCKRLMYEVLAQHYGHTQQTPLLSNHVFDIHSGISELLGMTASAFVFGAFVVMRSLEVFPQTHHLCFSVLSLSVNGKLAQALETIQLSLKLQDSRSREELRRLLRFMATAAKPQEVKLHKEVEAGARRTLLVTPI